MPLLGRRRDPDRGYRGKIQGSGITRDRLFMSHLAVNLFRLAGASRAPAGCIRGKTSQGTGAGSG